MSEMVERVARVLTELAGYDPDEAVINLSKPDGKGFRWEFSSTQARAVIEAMREPTKAMVTAAMVQPHPSVAESGGVIQQGEAAIRIDWRAMIDEALK